MAAQAFFLPASSAGERFCVYHAPQRATPRALLLYLHPFAEEMNKSRRMAALQARALAEAGYAVLQIDLLGCGDSSGEFADATWDAWIGDAALGCQWLRRRHAEAPLWLWGLRAGCLLATAVSATAGVAAEGFLFWQPPTAGRGLLHQFLRLKLAADLAGGKAGAAVRELREQLARSEVIEVAGYSLSPELAAGLESATLAPPPGAPRLEWIECSTRAEATLAPASSAALTEWQDRGARVRARTVEAPAFWQAVEIEEAPALLSASLAALETA